MISSGSIRSTLLYNLGTAHKHLGNDEEAMAYISIFINLFRKASKKFNPKPIPCCKKVLSGAPSVVTILSNIGHIHFRAGKYAETLDSYKKAIEITCDCHTYYHLDVNVAMNSIGVLRSHGLSSIDPIKFAWTVFIPWKRLSLRKSFWLYLSTTLGCCILNLRADGLMHNGRLYTNRSLVCRERSLYGRLLIAETIDIYQGYLLNVLT
jgi:tetratricopeptide (TPR) repeat protein